MSSKTECKINGHRAGALPNLPEYELAGFRCTTCKEWIVSPEIERERLAAQEPEEVLSKEEAESLAITLRELEGENAPIDDLIPLIQKVAREAYAKALETPNPAR